MPEVNRFEFVSQVRSQPAGRAVRIMTVTSGCRPGCIRRAFAAGAHEYVIEHITRDTILGRLPLLGHPVEATNDPTSVEHFSQEAGAGLTATADRTSTSTGEAVDSARCDIDANRSEPRICDCCASASTVAYYPLKEAHEQHIDDWLSTVCTRCLQLIEAGNWSRLRDLTSPAADRRAIRRLWMGFRQNRVGLPVPLLPAPSLRLGVTTAHAVP